MGEIIWQDVVLMIGNILFLFALAPSIMSTHKPSKWTSLLTAGTLSVFTLTYHTLGLTYATVTVALTAVGWWILYFQKRR